LIWPKTKISQFIEKDENIQKFDTHLVFEYAEGDTILNGRYRAPRSNRFYFVHDPNGGKLRQLEIYHEILHNDQELKNKVQRHMFGGY
jgi:ADP-dependent phosphofructokinase/glucokinase